MEEVGEVAGVDLVDAAGAHAVAAAIEALHGRRGEASPVHGRRPVHGLQGGAPPGVRREVAPEGSAPLAARQLQGGQGGPQAVGPVPQVHALPDGGEQGLDPAHHEGGAQGGAVQVRRRPGDHQAVRGLGQGGVEVLQLDVEQVQAAGGQLNALPAQLLPVLPVQEALAGLDRREHVVVGPQEEENLDPVAVVAGNLGCLDLVQRHGDGAHVVLGQHQLQEPGELLRIQGRVLQNLCKLVHYAAKKLPELCVLGGALELPQLLQTGGAPLQLVRQVQLLQEGPQHLQLSTGPGAVLQPRRQAAQGASHAAAQGVDVLQRRCLLRREALPPAGGVGGPVLVPDPHGAVDIPLDDVVLQPVALIVCEAPEAGLQIAEHVLVLIAAADRVQGPGQKAEHRLLQNVAAAAEVHRHTVALEDVLNGGGVAVQISGRYGDVPEAIAACPHQGQNFRRRILRLVEDAVRAVEGYRRLRPLPGDHGTEKMGGKVLQGGLGRGGGQDLQPALPAAGRG